MKQLKNLSALGIACVFLFSSCGSDEGKTASSASDSTKTTDSTSKTVSTVDTTASNVLLIWHKVADFSKWKTAYESHDSARMAAGIHNYVIGRCVDDSNLVLVALKVDDVEKAKAFSKDPGLKAAMQKGGVLGAPEMVLTTTVYQDNAPNMATLRSMTSFAVKDWAGWKKVFESNRQSRLDNGITDRAYGYDVDDNHKVTLVTAINDTAKASAFWKSDLLKKQRAESGVIGEVKRRIYRVVQKY